MSTSEVVDRILAADPNVAKNVRREVRLLLSTNDTWMSESAAASRLGVSRSTLCRWRNGKWAGARKAYPFSPRKTPAGRVQYNALEVERERLNG